MSGRGVRAALARRTPAPVRRIATRRASAGAETELAAVASGPRPLIAGPWTSEVGFELLYWIPLLRRLLGEHGVPPEDVIAVSRGGVSSWYDGIAGDYVELFDRVTAEGLQAQRLRRRRLAGSEKQAAVLPEEQELVEALAQERGHESFGWLHPRLMYRLFERDWSWDGDVEHVLAHTLHAPLRAAGAGELDDVLPAGPFVAVKAYFSDLALPDDEPNRRELDAVLERFGARLPVVALAPAVAADEHRDHDAAGVTVLRDELVPGRNLAQQTAVVARAAALVSTYGGFSYLGPHLGVPTLAIASHETHNLFHLRLFRHVLDRLGRPPFAGPVPLADAVPALLPLDGLPG